MKTDVIERTKSVTGKNIRLTLKQWYHVIEAHDYMAGNIEKVMETVNNPDYIVKGLRGELLALKYYSKTSITEKHCVVVYRENDEGFIITAFMTSKPERIIRREVLWQK